MELSITRQLKNKVKTLVNHRLLKQGKVLEVRRWPNSPLIEIDLHLPHMHMQDWSEVPAIKFNVGDWHFRDYTPFGWDAETSTCSLLIDAAHNGPGSSWAKRLNTGDTVQYLKSESTHQAPHSTNLVVALGDNTSLAHLLALRQLTLPAIRFTSAILTDSAATADLMTSYFPWSPALHFNEEALTNWLLNEQYCTEHTSFYLTGNKALVVRLRRLLRSLGHPNIKVKGFWG
jgi:NADPH-dependent ferric siderophore reductase